MSDLAVHGGPKAAAELTVPEWPQITDRDEENVLQSLRSGYWCRLDKQRGRLYNSLTEEPDWVTRGLVDTEADSFVERFEDEFAAYQDAEHAVAVYNGTVALEVALRICGVRPGDEVLVPDYTFIATASSVLSLGAIPKFVDVDPNTGNIDPDSLREKVSDDTDGVIAVHYSGYPIDFDEILPIVDEYDLFLIEDSAHAQGTEWNGRKVGTIGDVGTFSFQETKTLAGGEGGIVITDDDVLAEQLELLHNTGRIPGEHHYKHYIQGSNYRMSELHGALLCAQLERLPDEMATRHRNEEILRSELEPIDGVTLKPENDRITSRGYYFFTFNYEPSAFAGMARPAFLEALTAEGVPAGPGYLMPLHREPAFRREHITPLVPDGTEIPLYQNMHLPGAEEITRKEIDIPHQILLAEEADMKLVTEAVRKVQKNAEDVV